MFAERWAKSLPSMLLTGSGSPNPELLVARRAGFTALVTSSSLCCLLLLTLTLV